MRVVHRLIFDYCLNTSCWKVVLLWWCYMPKIYINSLYKENKILLWVPKNKMTHLLLVDGLVTIWGQVIFRFILACIYMLVLKVVLVWWCYMPKIYRSNCRYNMMLSKLMHIKYHQKGTSPFPCIMRGKEMWFRATCYTQSIVNK